MRCELPARTRARWDPASKTVTCLACVAAALSAERPGGPGAAVSPLPVDEGTAGASAMREYTRRRDAREQRMRERLGVVGVGLARLVGDPSSTRVWRQGAEGEEKVATRLRKLLDGTGVHLLHDRRLVGHGKANIDHLAVGPGGVTVIDAKAVRGDVRVQAVGGLFSQRERLLKVAGRDRTRLVRGVRGQAEVVRTCLSTHGFHAVEVRCALCFADAGGFPVLRRLELDGVIVDGPKRVAKLARRPGSLRETEVQRVLQALADALPAA